MPTLNDHNRREFLQGTLAVAGSALATSAAGTATAEAATKPKRPNLVFFFGEGQRADALSIEGHPILKTPNHDRIGAEGMRFKNAFCTNALCAPARAVALTGLYSRTSGALANEDMNLPLAEDIPLFTDLLHAAGYEVAVVGKIHFRNGAEDRYWDYYFAHNAAGNNYHNPFYKEGRNGKIGPQKQYPHHYADDLATDRALAWIEEERGDKPFCLLMWFVTPHSPFYRARRHLDLYRDVVIPKPETFDDDLKGYPGKPKCFAEANNKIGTTVMGDTCRTLEEVAKDYYAGLVAVDENIGRIMDLLEKKKILEDTAILHSSDHGYFMGEWRLYDKRLMHEPSIRVPMQIRYPKRIPANIVRQEMALDVDIAPTLLDLAGVPIPEHMQGKSLIPLAKADDPTWRKEWFYEYFEYPCPEMTRPCRGIRTERYKLIEYQTEPKQYEMYDLQKDPKELNNLWDASKHADLQKEMMERLNKLDAATPHRKRA